MDYLNNVGGNGADDERLIEDYFLGGGGGGGPLRAKSSFGLDQQFARPIEDEDLFGPDLGSAGNQPADGQEDPFLGAADENVTLDFTVDPLDRDNTNLSILGERNTKSPGNLLECLETTKSGFADRCEANDSRSLFSQVSNAGPERSSSPALPGRQQPNDSSSTQEEANRETTTPPPARDNDASESYSREKVKSLTPAQIRKEEMRKKILRQAKTLAIKPNKIGTGFGPDGFIEFTVEVPKPDTSCKAKPILAKMSNRTLETSNSQKTSWAEHKVALLKKICADKRKIWDSSYQAANLPDEDEYRARMAAKDGGSEDENAGSDGNAGGGEEDDAGTDDDAEMGNKDPADEEVDEDDGVEHLDFEGVASEAESKSDLSLGGDSNSGSDAESDDEPAEDEPEDVEMIEDSNEANSHRADASVKSADSDESEDEGANFHLNLDDEESSHAQAAGKGRRPVFIDDEASEE